MSDQEQQAQAAVEGQPQAVKEGQWPRYDKHVLRIMRTGLEESQAAEIVEVQREVATEEMESATEKFVTREHFDSQVGNLKSGMDGLQGQVNGLQGQVNGIQGQINGLQGQVSDLGARVGRLEGKMQILLWAIGISASILLAFLAFQSALLVTILRNMG